jgi:redox-sensitive bicupin YhaK (pirin superfamily)
MQKPIKYVLSAPLVEMGDILVHQPLPNNWTKQIDPFLLVHHWSETLKGDQKQKEVGVGPHPHCGFSPVTMVFKGGVHHRDSLGNSSIVMNGGVQWINSGKGIIHSERPITELAKNGGELEIIQFWVNTPAKQKKHPPEYFALKANDIPVHKFEDGKSIAMIISGEIYHMRGKAQPASPMLIVRFDLKKGCVINVPVSEKYNTFIYQLNGKLIINESEEIEDKVQVWFENKGDEIRLHASENAQLILFAGEPINEKTVNYGPFVMNNESEILNAMRDYQMGKMGILIEEFD